MRFQVVLLKKTFQGALQFCVISCCLSCVGVKAEKGLSWEQRLNICLGVALGVAYLHEELQTSIVHRDIKTENILHDGDFRPKIADFGLARNFSDESSQSLVHKSLQGLCKFLTPTKQCTFPSIFSPLKLGIQHYKLYPEYE